MTTYKCNTCAYYLICVQEGTPATACWCACAAETFDTTVLAPECCKNMSGIARRSRQISKVRAAKLYNEADVREVIHNQYLRIWVLPEQMKVLNLSKAMEYNVSFLYELTAEQVQAIPVKELANLTAHQWRNVPTNFLRKLSKEQIQGLPVKCMAYHMVEPWWCELSSEQRSWLTPEQLSGVHEDMIPGIMRDFTLLTEEQIYNLPERIQTSIRSRLSNKRVLMSLG